MSKLLYNGVELPPVPAHDADATVEVISAVLPAALSMYAQSPYILVIGKGTLWQGGKCYVRGVSAVYRLSGDAWMWHYGSGTVSAQDIVAANYFEAIWTNTDIPTADGAGIYLAASAPVDPNAPDEPEPEEPPVEPNVDVAAIYRRGWMDGFLSGINIRGILRRRKVEEPAVAYLSFSSDEAFSIATANAAKSWDGALYYSTDAKTWAEWDGAAAIASAEHSGEQRLYMRGTGNSKITSGYNGRWVLTGNGVDCSGNIESLLDFATVAKGEHPPMAGLCYHSLFYKWAGLVSAPELPATELAQACYQEMFYECAITAAPELPATILAANCYLGMFGGCSSLTVPPALPATTLANNCYSSMFSSTGLTTPPELPATTLADYCYSNMFSQCYDLATPPRLPATTLTQHCYDRILSDCRSLKTPPALPATTLASYCYDEMFYGCTGLTAIPKLPATALGYYSYYRMFYGCTGIKLSATKTGAYQTAYRIPYSGTGTTGTNSLSQMLTNTGGTFTGTPTINTTYYTSNTVV